MSPSTDRTILRVDGQKQWQRAGVFYVRTEAMCRGYNFPLEMEFSEDTPDSLYILALKGIVPVATCRLHYLDEKNGKIERVVALEEYRHRHYASDCIREAENWFMENGVETLWINARRVAIGLYEKLGYKADYTQLTGEGDFQCVMMMKEIRGNRS